MKVKDVMSAPVVSVRPDSPFGSIVELMLTNVIGGVPVITEDGELVGIVTEGDLVSKEAFGGHHRRPLELLADLVAGGESPVIQKARATTAEQLMTRDVQTVGPELDLRKAARVMVEHQRKRLPVVDAGRVVGMLSRRDVLRLFHRSDSELLSDVNRLLADPLRSPERHQVTATVGNGVVTLAGTVLHPTDAEVLEAMTWRVPGVVGVISKMTAREPEPRPSAVPRV